MRLTSVMAKNFKLLFRSKRQAILIIFGPILLMVLVGLAFSNAGVFDLSVGTYSASYNDLSNQFTDSLSEKFSTVKYEDQESCINDVKQRVTHACVVFPENLQAGVEGQNEISYHVDYSNINLVGTLSGLISEVSSAETGSISTDFTNDVLGKLDETQKNLGQQDVAMQDLASKVNTLSSEVGQIKQTLNQVNTDTTSFDSLDEDLAELVVLIDSFENDSEILIDDIKGTLSNASLSTSDVNQLEDDIEGFVSDVNSIQSSISSGAGSAKTKLEDVKTKKSSALSKISSIENKISEALNKINQAKQSNKDLNVSINNLQFRNASSIVSPIKTKIQPVVAEEANISSLFPALLVLLIMFIGIMVGSTMVISEKNSQAFFRNFTTPTRDLTFIMATFLTIILLLVMQLALVMSISAYFFEINLLSNIWVLVLALLLLIVTFSLLGMLIGFLSKNEETSTLFSISAGSVLLLLSSLILPIETMPAYIKQIIVYNPFVIGQFLIKKVVTFQLTMKEVGMDLVTLLIYSVVLFLLVLLAQKISKTTFLFHFTKSKKRNREREAMFSKTFYDLKPNQYFKLDDGTTIKSLPELIDEIELMNDESFRRYTRKGKNDFAEWIEKVLDNKELAKIVRAAKTKDKLLKELRKGL